MSSGTIDQQQQQQPQHQNDGGLLTTTSFADLKQERNDILLKTDGPFYFKLPSIVAVIGPTGVGKSELVASILRDRDVLIQPNPDIILYVYNIYQKELFERLQNWCNGKVIFLNGLDELKKITFSTDLNTVLVLDDQQRQISDSKEFGIELMTVKMHHNNLLIFYICQSLFLSSKHNTLISRQASYVIIFRNKRTSYEANAVARECMQLKSNTVHEIFKIASLYSQRPYLVFDCNPTTSEYRQLTTNILKSDRPKFFIYLTADDSSDKTK